MTSELCLTIDLGTGGPKVGLVTLDGEVLSYEVHAVETLFAGGGAATQDAQRWWTLICESTRRLMALDGVTRERVKAVAVTGQYASTVPVDANGVPTGPCLTWQDSRGGALSRAAFGGHLQGYNARKLLHFLRKTAGAPVTTGGDPVGHMLYLSTHEAAVTSRTRWFMEPVDYLTMRFTGVATATHASRFASWLADTRHLSFYDYDEKLLELVGIDKTKLPPLVPFASIVGTVTPDVAADLGLSDEAIVITGLLDLHAAAVGSGATRPFETHVALSTTSWISCPVTSKKTDILHSILTVPGLTNDSYLIFNQQDTGAKALEWLRTTLSPTSALSYDELNALASASPPGANGVVFTPWLAGQISPVSDHRVRGAFSTLSVTTSTGDLVRAVMEGVAANSAWLFHYVEKFAGRRLEPLRILGGGAQSDLWCQIFADTFDREVHQVSQPLIAQLRGAALLAALALGEHTLDELATRPASGRTFTPTSPARERYRERREQMPQLFARDQKFARRK